MKWFVILITIISAYVISKFDSWFIGLALLIFVIIVLIQMYRNERKYLCIVASIFALCFCIGLIDLNTFQNSESFTGIVIKSKENYCVMFDGFERFYVNKYGNNDIKLFDVVRIDGNFSNLDFASIESEFDFTNYLKNQGIRRQIYINSYTHIINMPIDCSRYKLDIISLFQSQKSITLVNLLLLDEVDYNTTLILNLKSNSIFYLFSLSGIYLNYFFYKINSFFNRKMKESLAILLTLLLLIPIFILNIDSFIIKRLTLFYFVKLIALKFKYKDTLSIRSISYIVLLINKYNVYQYGFIMPLLISTFMSFSRLLFKRKKRYIKRFVPQVLTYVLIIPFTIEFNNCINLLTIIFSMIIIPFIRFLYYLLFPLIFLIKLPFLENILDFAYDFLLLFDLKFLNINAPKMSQFFVVIHIILVFFTLYLMEINFKKIAKKIIVADMLFLLIYFVPITNSFTNQVSFINVGQGDSTLIRVKNKTILIDTGGSLYKDIATNSLIPYFKSNRIYKIDALFITHYDMDHYYASESLKKYFNVTKVYDYNNFDEYNNEILPIYNINNNILDNVEENSRSLVLWFSLGGKKFLLMGDAPVEIEKNIMFEYKDLDCDYLKVGHHGSDTSSSLEFLKHVSPEEAIISCGVDNMYGHPSDKVLRNLNTLKIKVRRTDLEGTIEYLL